MDSNNDSICDQEKQKPNVYHLNSEKCIIKKIYSFLVQVKKKSSSPNFLICLEVRHLKDR